MNKTQKLRLSYIILSLLGISIVIGLILKALSYNINLFYSPIDIIEDKVVIDSNCRVGGMVKPGSFTRKDLVNEFVITDYKADLTIHYTGILPDLFREGQGIVAQGKLVNKNLFKASQVLAKHDESYMPPEVAKRI